MDHFWTLIVAAGVFLFHLVGILTVIDALRYQRSSQGTIAWLFSLVLFPYLSVPLYWTLGRNDFKGYTIFREKELSKLSLNSDLVRKKVEAYDLLADQEGHFSAVAKKLTQIPTFSNNSVELLVNGEATFDSIMEGVAKARNYILVQFYIIEDDSLGQRLADALIERAKDGVRIFFLYDKIGSKINKKFVAGLRDNGIQIYDFYAKKGIRNPLLSNFRNHRKIVVVDGKTCWIGGHNVSTEYLGEGRLGFWRDTHVKIDGPSVLMAQLSFLQDWYWLTKKIEEVSWDPYITGGDLGVMILPTGPADAQSVAQLSFLHAINSARDRLWIASPYFVPDEALTKALQVAAYRGVDVRILIPDNPDHFLVYHATYAYFADVIDSGVRFYRYTTGFMHQKVMVIDDTISSVGTVNFDNRSFHLNFEITAFVYGESFATEVAAMLSKDFESSKLMTHKDLKLSKFGIIKSRFANLFSPIL